MFGLFRPLEEYIGASILTMDALCSVVLLCFTLKLFFFLEFVYRKFYTCIILPTFYGQRQRAYCRFRNFDIGECSILYDASLVVQTRNSEAELNFCSVQNKPLYEMINYYSPV
jgi:hypothetical protein